MKATVMVDAGICGFITRVSASSEDDQNVTFKITSECENIRAFGAALASKEPVDAYAELGLGVDGSVFSAARQPLKGCCTGCAVPIAVFKAMQVAARVALPKDVAITFVQEV